MNATQEQIWESETGYDTEIEGYDKSQLFFVSVRVPLQKR